MDTRRDPFAATTVRSAYDVAARDYAAAFGDDLAQLPLDREMLDAAIAAAPAHGWVLEAGCGPAPAATHLGAVRMLGIDLSHEMLVIAGERSSELPRAQADVRRLPLRDGSCALVIAFYVVQHLGRTELGRVLDEVRRVLRMDGVLLMAAHLGDSVVISTEFLGHPVAPVGGTLYSRDDLLAAVVGAGFVVDLERQRGPLPNEFASQRLYLLAHRTTATP
ncbi:MAG: class I SAM-dependent methyltransferase [Ilumatobacteraceae bacterium]